MMSTSIYRLKCNYQLPIKILSLPIYIISYNLPCRFINTQQVTYGARTQPACPFVIISLQYKYCPLYLFSLTTPCKHFCMAHSSINFRNLANYLSSLIINHIYLRANMCITNMFFFPSDANLRYNSSK